MGDGCIFFYIILVGVVVNGIFDWFLVCCLGFGVVGLVIVIMIVNFVFVGLFFFIFLKRFEGFWMVWYLLLLVLMGCGIYIVVVMEVVYD